MNPLDTIFSWQALLVAALASLGTEAGKRLLDYMLADRWESLRSALRQGADVRRQVPAVQWLLPLFPVLLGLGLGLLLPIRPEVLVAYYEVDPTLKNELALYGAWGAACGALGDYLHERVREPLRARRNQRAG